MSAEYMQTISVHQYGGPEQLHLEKAERPSAREGEVLVKVYAVGVLPIEWKIRQGLFQKFQPASFPYIPGNAFAGQIVEVGPGVSAFQPGQAVFGRSNRGAYAEYTTASVETIALKPENVSFAEAASISGGATTAWTALFENGKLSSEQRVLIHGAAGGVGSFAVQFASLKGAQVIATAGANNLDFVRSLGAETVLDYTTVSFEQEARQIDLVLDTIGGETLKRSFSVVKPGGTIVSLIEEPSQELAQQYGIRAIKNTASPPFPSTKLLTTIAQLLHTGKVQVVLGPILPLSEAAEAHRLSESGHGRGRIVLRVLD